MVLYRQIFKKFIKMLKSVLKQACVPTMIPFLSLQNYSFIEDAAAENTIVWILIFVPC